MTPNEARDFLKKTLLHVDFNNLGTTINALVEGHTWTRFDNGKWRPDKNLAWRDAKWLASNADSVYSALSTLKAGG
jgi:hypothetical protein